MLRSRFIGVGSSLSSSSSSPIILVCVWRFVTPLVECSHFISSAKEDDECMITVLISLPSSSDRHSLLLSHITCVYCLSHTLVVSSTILSLWFICIIPISLHLLTGCHWVNSFFSTINHLFRQNASHIHYFHGGLRGTKS